MARLVTHLSKRAGTAVESAAELNLSEMTLLGHLRSQGGSARMVDLATHLQVTKAAVTKLVDSLERMNLIRRDADADDRRVTQVVLTAEAVPVLSAAEQAFEEEMRVGLWENLSDAETKALSKILGRVERKLGLSDGPIMPPQGG